MQLTLPVHINPKLTFSNFITKGNEYVLQNLQQRAEQKCDVLYIYGESYGKTHLLNAFTNKFAHIKNIIYIDICTHNLELIEQQIDTIDILLLDNLHCANQLEQKLIFDIYNQSKQAFNLVITGKYSIANQSLFADLQTRISQALSIKIQMLDDTQVLDALMLKAKDKNLELHPDIIVYLQKNYSRDLKTLVQMLEKLSDKALQRKQKISKQLIKEISIYTNYKK